MNPEELIAAHLDGTLGEAGSTQLNVWLKASPENMKRFTSAVMFDQEVRRAVHAQASEPAAQTLMSSTGPRPVKSSRRIHWRPMWAAAAGLALGLFSATMVYGIITQRHVRVDTLLSEGFENASMPIDASASARRDVWAGELLAPRGEKGQVKPAEGKLMAVLPPHDRRRLSYAFRFFDLNTLPVANSGQTRQIEVTGRFHGETPGVRDKFQICLAAFAEDVAEAREIWTKNAMDDQALLHVTRTVKTEPDAFSWTVVRAVIDVPVDAKVLLVSLAAGIVHAEAPKTEHYIDDVQVRLITSDAVLP